MTIGALTSDHGLALMSGIVKRGLQWKARPVPKGVDRDRHIPSTLSPNIWTGVHYHDSFLIIWGVQSSQDVFRPICWFRGILLHQNAYFTLTVTRTLQFLGEFVPRPPTRAVPLLCPWIVQGGTDFQPQSPPMSPNHGDWSTPMPVPVDVLNVTDSVPT